jgi:hypothetical protein
MNLFSLKTALPAIIVSSILATSIRAAPPAKPTLDSSSHAAHVAAGIMPPDAPKGDPTISQLQAKVAQLEASLAKSAPAASTVPAGAAKPGMPAAGATPPAGPMAGMATPPAGPMAGMATPPAGPMAGMAMPPAGPMAGMAGPSMGAAAAPAPAMAGMGGSGGGMNMMGMMDKMMGMMDKMMSMEGGSMPMGGAPMTPATADGMDMDKMKMGGMGMDKMKMGGMDKMKMGGMAMDKMKMGGMGMMGMSPMGGGASGAMSQSALPGFPGASHLYHLGATDFFLDHQTHIALTTEQTVALNKAKEQALLARGTADRKVEQAEQELWTLTASDQPDAATIEAKIGEIEKTRGDARLAFIRAVGEASKLLTNEQRQILTGFAPPAPAAPAAAMAPMKGM